MSLQSDVTTAQRAADPAAEAAGAAPAPQPPAGGQDWRVIVAIFWITSMVEGLGVSQVFAFLPSYLRGVARADRRRDIGLEGHGREL
jgi:hypothetical protein